MAHPEENRSIDSEYLELTIEEDNSSEDVDHHNEGTTRVSSLEQETQRHHQRKSQSSDLKEYEFDPSSVLNEVDDGDEETTLPYAPLVNHHRKGSPEKINPIQDKRIKMLLEANKAKEERLQALEKELHHQKVQHKEGIYWLQLQLDTARREKTSAEERMVELQADLKQMAQMEQNKTESYPDDDVEFYRKADIYETSLGVMENQLTMVKTSCGEVVKTLKEEIADLMEDRSRVELELLNQLSTLDSDKNRAELEYELRLNEKDEIIERLQTMGDVKENESVQKDRIEAEDIIRQLNDDKARLERELEDSTDDMALLQSKLNSTEATTILRRISREREEINASLARVTTVWELADASVEKLEDAIDRLRPTNISGKSEERDKMLSTLESASLLNGQIKVSLLLVELKLRNQLQCLKNDKLTLGKAAPSDDEVTRTMEEIQKDALTALSQVEKALTNQLIQLKETALKEAAETKGELRDRVKKLEEMKREYHALEAEVTNLKNSNQESDCFAAASLSEGENSGDRKDEKQTVSVSGPVMNQLHAEVMRIVERIQEKNETIASLKEELEDHKTREDNLRKELKRSLRANHVSQIAGRSTPHTPTKTQSPPSGSRSKTKKLTSSEKAQLASPPSTNSPTKGSVRTPVKAKATLCAPEGDGKSPQSTNSALYTPTSSIRPLLPSPREVSRPRHSVTSNPWSVEQEGSGVAHAE